MGANLLPVVRSFSVATQVFKASDCEVQEGCTSVGTRKLLKFDFLCWNVGSKDIHLGNPSQNPQWYEFSKCHGHYHLKNFNDYRLYDCKGRFLKGQKQAFCLMDIEQRDATAGPRKFTCADQGITAGWADVYNAGLDCQWIDITGLRDGDYVLETRTNANGIVREDWYGDNSTWVGVRISRNTVQVIPVPCYPEDCLGFSPQNVQAQSINGSWKVVDGNHWMMDFRNKRADAQRAADIIKHYGMNRMCFVGRPSRTGKQLMMYFKINNSAPTGPFPGEDAIRFNPANVTARQVGKRWKVTEGSMWMLDFGASEANARKAEWIIKKYDFKYQCFVGRPNAPMMYFRK